MIKNDPNNPLVSVIIPCYNSSATIERALNSVVAQHYKNVEVIVVDDGSADVDKTESVVNDFGDERIIFVKHIVNKNGAATRNSGIKQSKGEYIAFLDSDDEWQPTHLSYALQIISNGNIDLVYSQALVKTNNPDIVMPMQGIASNQRISDYLFVQGGVIFTPTILVKSFLAKSVEFNEELRRHQDYDFLLRCEVKNIKIGFTNKPTVIVHWENNDIKKKGGTWDFSFNFAKEYKQYFTPKAYSRFILKFVTLPLLEEKKRYKGISLLLKNSNLSHFSILNFYFILSYLIFGTFKHPYKWKK